MFDGVKNSNENRIIFLTDMLVNSGTSDGDGLYNLTKQFVDKKFYNQKIYMTYLGNILW